MRYASNTTVNADKSRNEIQKTLIRYGAQSFMYAMVENRAAIQFDMHGRRIRFDLPFPNPDDFSTNARGARRPKGQAAVAWEKACRQRWRALALAVKAKLEAVESGITTFEEEFLAHIVLPDGRTVGGWVVPQIEQSYKDQVMPLMLPPPKK